MNTKPIQAPRRNWSKFVGTALLASAFAFGGAGSALAQSNELSLITPNADAGFALAVKLSQRGVATTQTDPAERKKLRPEYATDADSLIAVSQVIAIHFQTVAAANNYWRQ